MSTKEKEKDHDTTANFETAELGHALNELVSGDSYARRVVAANVSDWLKTLGVDIPEFIECQACNGDVCMMTERNNILAERSSVRCKRVPGCGMRTDGYDCREQR